jgi:hypothetical protein
MGKHKRTSCSSNSSFQINTGFVPRLLVNESGYANSNGLSTDELALIGDVNGDGKFTNADLQSLVALLESGNGSTSVPEPMSMLLLAIGGLAMVRTKRLGRAAGRNN